MTVFRNLITQQKLSDSNILLPEDVASLCFWIDGQYNTKEGPNRDIGYFEDLVGKTNTGYYQIGKNPVGTWDGDFLVFNSYATYDAVNAENFTVEFLCKIEETVSTYAISNCYRPSATGSLGYGWSIILTNTTDNQYNCQLKTYKGNMGSYDETDININSGVMMIQIKYENSQYHLFINGIKQEVSNSGSNPYSQHICFGVWGYYGTSPNIQLYTGLKIGMARIFLKPLSDEQIYKNYLDTKKRFNF